MRVNGKAKGSSFERKVSKFLSDITGLTFRRTFGSGAFKSKHEALDESGDLKCSDPNFMFSIECKFYKELNYNSVIVGTSRQLDSWISQCIEDSKRVGKRGLLIVKTNNNKPLVFLCMKKSDKVKIDSIKNTVKSYVVYKGIIGFELTILAKVWKMLLE